MKRLLFFLSAIIALNYAKATTVFFVVDMGTQTISANGMHIAGDFQSPAWSPSATPMTKLPITGTNIYYYAFSTTTPGKIEYKYINGNDWNLPGGTSETVPTDAKVSEGNANRWYVVDTTKSGDTVLVGWQAVSSSAFAIIGYNKQYVRFGVNMAKETSIDSAGVLIAGNFDGLSNKSQMLNLDNTTKVYEAQMWLSAGSYQFKYENGPSGWESVPSTCATSGNRSITVATSSMVLTTVCFSECGNCNLNLPKYNVTFNTDISEEVACSSSIDSVDVTGNRTLLGNWGNPGQKMTKVGSTNTYTLTINQFDSGTVIEYKYRVWSKGIVSLEQVGWTADGNRSLNIVSNTTLPVNCFGKQTACTTPPASSQVTFKVDFAGSGITPGSKVYLVGRGNNAWVKGGTSGKIEMNSVPNTGGKAYQVVIDSICPGTIYYNFANDTTGEVYDTAASQRTCLSPSGIGYQRVYQRPAGASTVYYVFGKCTNGVTAIDYNGTDESFRMYPNPMSSSTNLQLGSGSYTINIIDVTGKVVRSYPNSTGMITISKGDLPSGIYVVDVLGNNTRNTEKLSIH